MNMASKRAFGWVLVGGGLCIVVFSHKIVFPGLESLLGIETIVGKQNVVYLPEDIRAPIPGAMVRWIFSVAAVGVVLAVTGCAVLSVHVACHSHECQRAEQSCWSGCQSRGPVCIRKSLPWHHSARAFGFARIPNIHAMRVIIQIATACLIAFSAVAADPSKSPVFQIRLVADVPSDETEPMVLLHQREGRTNSETLYVSRTVLFDQTALKSAKVIPGTERFGARIQIVFTEEGKQRFAELTRKSIGKRLAIMIHRQIYSAPIVRAEITGGIGEIGATHPGASQRPRIEDHRVVKTEVDPRVHLQACPCSH